MKYVIFHGSFSSPESNWFPSLSEELHRIGQEVIIPQFPVDSFETLKESDQTKQNLPSWLEVFRKNILPDLENKKLCFIGHSLGSLFILHAVSKFNLQLDSAIFVSPFLTVAVGRWQSMKVNSTFYTEDFDWDRMKSLIPTSYAVFSDNDPYIPIENMNKFAGCMNSQKIIIPGGEHCGSNFPKFPLIEDLCKSRIVK